MDPATGKGPVTTGPVTIRGKKLLQGYLELAISSAGGGRIRCWRRLTSRTPGPWQRLTSSSLYFEPSHKFAAPFSDMRPNVFRHASQRNTCR